MDICITVASEIKNWIDLTSLMLIVPVDLIERKMRSLRTQYRRYKNQESLRNGTVGKRAPYLLKRMRFLEPFLKPLKEGGGDMEGAEEDQMYQVTYIEAAQQ